MPPVELQCWDLLVGLVCPVTSVPASCTSLVGFLTSEEAPLCLHYTSRQDECSILAEVRDLPGADHQAPESKLG